MRIIVFERPTTSWDVLERVKELAREEPLRIWMRIELCRRAEMVPARELPACGTVGCVGGWSSILLGMVGLDDIDHYVHLGAVGARMGLTESQKDELFYPREGEIRWYNYMGGQTRSYANEVIDHISAFQQKYEQQLKAHHCQVGPSSEEEGGLRKNIFIGRL